MERHYQLKVTSDTTNIDVDSVDAEEVARIVQLAGLNAREVTRTPAPGSIPVPPPGPMSAMPDEVPAEPSMDMGMDAGMDDDQHLMEQTCSICGSYDHNEASCPDMFSPPMTEIREMQAAYDFGSNHSEPEDVDVDTYTYDASRLPQHFGKQGDNTLDDPLKESATQILSRLEERYHFYMAETRENEDGSLSPLSDPDVPDFDKDPFTGDPVDDGSRSPFSTVVRQPSNK